MIGRSIGNYKIVRVLGEGGMGTVYLAEHPMIGKRVAVKMLRPDLGSDPGLVSRFFQEAKAVNDIRHPNIVDISDFGHTEDGTVYFVMELMEGESLRDRLSKHGPMPVDQVVETARQVPVTLLTTAAGTHENPAMVKRFKECGVEVLPTVRHLAAFARSCSTSAWPSWWATNSSRWDTRPSTARWWGRRSTCHPSRRCARM